MLGIPTQTAVTETGKVQTRSARRDRIRYRAAFPPYNSPDDEPLHTSSNQLKVLLHNLGQAQTAMKKKEKEIGLSDSPNTHPALAPKGRPRNGDEIINHSLYSPSP